MPKLLRRLADCIDELGDDVIVRDLLLEWRRGVDPKTYEFDEELGPSITVYYNRETE
jgi:hypothetical protein